jgi:hypothetical protein
MMGVQGAMAEEVNNRIQKASGELVDKYASGKGGEEDRSIVDGPTGGAYKEKYRAEQRAKKLLREKNNQEGDNTHQKKRSDDSDNEDDDDGDEDIELRRIREMRLRVIKDQQREKIENVGKGHGQYREITQDEFLNEMISSKIVVCHFYHAEFARCAIIDHHIQKLVQRHVETKFVKINAEKAPFFVSKVIYLYKFLSMLRSITDIIILIVLECSNFNTAFLISNLYIHCFCVNTLVKHKVYANISNILRWYRC